MVARQRREKEVVSVEEVSVMEGGRFTPCWPVGEVHVMRNGGGGDGGRKAWGQQEEEEERVVESQCGGHNERGWAVNGDALGLCTVRGVCVCVRVRLRECAFWRATFEPTSQRAWSSYLAQEEQLCLATTGALQSQAYGADSDWGRVLPGSVWSLTEASKCCSPHLPTCRNTYKTDPEPFFPSRQNWTRSFYVTKKDKSAFAPVWVALATPSSELCRELKVNLNHPNPKINYAYPKEQGSRPNP